MCLHSEKSKLSICAFCLIQKYDIYSKSSPKEICLIGGHPSNDFSFNIFMVEGSNVTFSNLGQLAMDGILSVNVGIIISVTYGKPLITSGTLGHIDKSNMTICSCLIAENRLEL